MRALFSFLKGLGLGAGAMYLLDPVAGRRRRSLLRDQAVGRWHELQDFVDRGVRDLGNRASGMLCELRSALERDTAPSDVVARRVRTIMGRHVAHPRAIDVAVDGDRIILRGPILASEIQPFINAVESVRGMMQIDNQLDVHSSPDVPELATEGRHRRSNSPAKGNWAPGTQLLAAAAGLAIAARCLGSRTGTVALLGGIGLGLLASDALEGRPVGGRPRRREGAPAGGADEESREQPTAGARRGPQREELAEDRTPASATPTARTAANPRSDS